MTTAWRRLREFAAVLAFSALLAGCAAPEPLIPVTAARSVPGYSQVGIASWYGPGFHGKRTASGQRYDMHAMTAAHKTLPFGTRVRVTNLENKRSVLLTINDRGPFVAGRIVDVSKRAAEKLGFKHKGKAKVRLKVVGRARG